MGILGLYEALQLEMSSSHHINITRQNCFKISNKTYLHLRTFLWTMHILHYFCNLKPLKIWKKCLTGAGIESTIRMSRATGPTILNIGSSFMYFKHILIGKMSLSYGWHIIDTLYSTCKYNKCLIKIWTSKKKMLEVMRR